MILLWQAVVVGVGVQGFQAHPKKFWFAENLGKSPENPDKNGVQRCLTSKNGAQGLHKKTWRPFWRLHQKEVFMIFVGETLQAKVAQKLYGHVWGNSGKILRIPRICLLLHYDEKAPACSYTMMKRHLLHYDEKAPRCTSFEREEGEMHSPCLHSSASLCILFYTHSLYSLFQATMCHCNEHKL